MTTEKKPSVTITCSMEDERTLNKLKNYEEICRQAWEMAFGADAPFAFNVYIESNNP